MKIFPSKFWTRKIDESFYPQKPTIRYTEDVINTAMRLYISFTKFYSHQHPPWFTSDIRHHIKYLHTLHHTFRLNPSDETAAKVKSLEVLLQEKITLTKNSYESSLTNDCSG